MLALNQANLANSFASQEDVIVTELRLRLFQVEQLIERLAPHMRAQQDAPVRMLGAPAPALSSEAVDAIERLQAAASALRKGISELSRAEQN
ncbi:hypothetical protein GCM10007036_17810 [Alsobacter metallidurans]|uniref:Uncharacterized protein n=1 Tax=Alsobacter metallidurans TaxID=340221 RepID=A0A917I730_9HYPH|nr:hypothetical protein [Alsobacter metallidurans]GGH16825.1 hypothetical protein GCM10007036_17810 [Alsobacter metallidurans]